jgi:hypothetical protein
LRWRKIAKLHSSKILHQKQSNSALLSVPGTREKKFSSNFKHYNLTIRVVNFYKTFCTCSPSSLGQDPMVESARKTSSFFIWTTQARNGNFGVFFEKKAPIQNSAPKMPSIVGPMNWDLLL